MRRTTAVGLLAVTALCAGAAPAAAAPRVAIAGVRNDPGGTVAASLARTACLRLECAPAELVYAGRRIDFATARQNGVDAVLFGTVSARGGRRVLALALLGTWALSSQRALSLLVVLGAAQAAVIVVATLFVLYPTEGPPPPEW